MLRTPFSGGVSNDSRSGRWRTLWSICLRSLRSSAMWTRLAGASIARLLWFLSVLAPRRQTSIHRHPPKSAPMRVQPRVVVASNIRRRIARRAPGKARWGLPLTAPSAPSGSAGACGNARSRQSRAMTAAGVRAAICRTKCRTLKSFGNARRKPKKGGAVGRAGAEDERHRGRVHPRRHLQAGVEVERVEVAGASS